MKTQWNFQKIFQPDDKITTYLTIDPWDAEFLKNELLRLPVSERGDCPVTLLCDYDGSVTVHPETNRDDGSTALKLARSRFEGDAFVMRTDRVFLCDALSLGTLEFHFGGKFPVATTDGKIYAWCPTEWSPLPLESERPYAERFLCSDQSSKQSSGFTAISTNATISGKYTHERL